MRKKNSKKNLRKRKNVSVIESNILEKQTAVPVSITASQKVKNYFWKLFGFISIIGTLLGLTAITYFLPKIEVSISQAVSETNPYAALVEIHNVGEFSVKNIDILVKVDSISIQNISGQRMKRGAYNITFADGDPVFKKLILLSGEYWTTSIPFGPLSYTYEPGFHLKYGDITVSLSYNYLWFNKQKKIRFYGSSSEEGKIFWTRQSVN